MPAASERPIQRRPVGPNQFRSRHASGSCPHRRREERAEPAAHEAHVCLAGMFIRAYPVFAHRRRYNEAAVRTSKPVYYGHAFTLACPVIRDGTNRSRGQVLNPERVSPSHVLPPGSTSCPIQSQSPTVRRAHYLRVDREVADRLGRAMPRPPVCIQDIDVGQPPGWTCTGKSPVVRSLTDQLARCICSQVKDEIARDRHRDTQADGGAVPLFRKQRGHRPWAPPKKHS